MMMHDEIGANNRKARHDAERGQGGFHQKQVNQEDVHVWFRKRPATASMARIGIGESANTRERTKDVITMAAVQIQFDFRICGCTMRYAEAIVVPAAAATQPPIAAAAQRFVAPISQTWVSQITSAADGMVTTRTAMIPAMRPAMIQAVPAQKAKRFVNGVTRASPKTKANWSWPIHLRRSSSR